jgi:hypothetical protein
MRARRKRRPQTRYPGLFGLDAASIEHWRRPVRIWAHPDVVTEAFKRLYPLVLDNSEVR